MASLKITGIDEAVRNLKNIDRVTPQALGAAVHMEMELLRTYILQGRRIPVDVGTLVNSLTLQPTKIRGDTITATLGVGGQASDYALIQHERMDFHHPGQGGPKYLEYPAKERAPGMGRSIAKRLAAAWRKVT